MIYEPVRFEDGTLVSDDKEAEALFEKDAVQTDTTFAENGDTLLTVRHTGAFMRIQLEGLPTDAGIAGHLAGEDDGMDPSCRRHRNGEGRSRLVRAPEGADPPRRHGIPLGRDRRHTGGPRARPDR